MLGNKLIYAAVYTLFIILNFAIEPGLAGLECYAWILGLFIIYKIRWEGPRELLYHFVLLFAVMDFSFNLPLFGRYNIYYFHIALFLLTVSGLIVWARRTKLAVLVPLGNKYKVFSLIFIVYLCLSLLWVQNLSLAVKYIINYGIMFCFLLAVYRFNSSVDKIKNTFYVLGCSSLGVLIIGLMEIFGVRMPIRNVFSDNRLYDLGIAYLYKIPTVFFYNPNNYGVYLVMLMSLLITGIVIARSKKVKLIAGLLYAVAMLNLIFTTSRTSWITLFVTFIALIVLFLLIKDTMRAKKVLKLFLATLVMFYGLSVMPGMIPYYGKFNATPMLKWLSLNPVESPKVPAITLGGEGSLNERFTIMVDVVKGVVLKGHPFGFGVANTSVYISTLKNTKGIYNTHSLWLELLGDFGIFMLIYSVYIYLSLLLDLLRMYRNSQGFIAYLSLGLFTVLGGFVLSSFGPSSVITFTPFWFFLGISVLLVNKGRSLASEKQQITEGGRECARFGIGKLVPQSGQ